MSVARLLPSEARGALDAPPSKSYTHRFVLAAHLSGRNCRVRGPLVSADTLRTARGIRQLGSSVQILRDVWKIAPGPVRPTERPRVIDCGESGTTLRFLTAAAALGRNRYRFLGTGRLPHRPMDPLWEALVGLGAAVTRGSSRVNLPFEIRGPIHGGRADLEVDQSSQFTSALLLSLPSVGTDSTVRTSGTPVSAPYVRATLAVLRKHGIRVSALPNGFRIPGGQRYGAVDESVPGDASSAAYLWAAAALTGGTVSVRGVPTWWPQADMAVLDLLGDYGAEVSRSSGAITVRGGPRRPFRVTLTDVPDLYPLAGVLAAAAPGRSCLIGGAHAAVKESDRRLATARLVHAMGGRSTEVPGGIAVQGTARPRRLRLRGVRDHRIVMSAAVAALAADGPSNITDASSVGKSFPGFFRALAKLGVEVETR